MKRQTAMKGACLSSVTADENEGHRLIQVQRRQGNMQSEDKLVSFFVHRNKSGF